MKYTRWIGGAYSEEAVSRLMEEGYPYLVSAVLAARGVETRQQAEEALERERERLLSSA